MRLSFHHRHHGHEIGAIELRNGIASPTNIYAQRRMTDVHLGPHQHVTPQHGEGYLRVLFDYYKRSTGVSVRLDP